MKGNHIGYARSGILGSTALALLLLGMACVSVSVSNSDDPSPVTEPGAYTRAFVEEAIEQYEDDGLDAALDYYNSTASVNGDWYVFIIDEDGRVIAHAAVPENVGQNVNDAQWTDINGFHFGKAILNASEDGDWVSYYYINPNNDDREEQKHSWVVQHDGLFFGSGWYQR